MHMISRALILGSLLGTSLGTGTFLPVASAVAATPDGFADLAERLSPAVVNISTTATLRSSPLDDMLGQQMPQQFREFFKDFLDDRGAENLQSERKVSSLGSGFIVDSSGIVVTNAHVIKDADEIDVMLTDGTKLKAQLLGKDIKSDLAVLKVTPTKPLPAVAFSDSTKARVGDWVIAIGNPFGLGGTVTAGIISARNRNINATPYDDFIQTDASINRGNSGGPLFNMQGEVVGVNSAILSPSGGSVGIGFAIPSTTVQRVVEQLQKNGRVERGWLGVSIQSVTPDIAESLGLKDSNSALIASVTPNSPAAKAGLEKGDIVTAVNEMQVTAITSLPKIIAALPIDSEANLKIIRKGKEITKTVKVARMKEDKEQMSSVASKMAQTDGIITLPKLGFSAHSIDDKVRRMYNLPDDMEGVIMTDVSRKGAVYSVGLRQGDVIIEAQQLSIRNTADLKTIVDDVEKQKRKMILLGVARDRNFHYVTVPLQE